MTQNTLNDAIERAAQLGLTTAEMAGSLVLNKRLLNNPITQNTLNEEIERLTNNYACRFINSLNDEYPTDLLWYKESIDFLRQSLHSIAEKTVEAERVERLNVPKPINDWGGLWRCYYDFYNHAATVQSKLADQWLGKE